MKVVQPIRDLISIHAPPRGATRMYSDFITLLPFQFTPLREGRRVAVKRTLLPLISIHAPPRGATFSNAAVSSLIEFQFTPLREGRLHCVSPFLTQPAYFNSRPSARGDETRLCRPAWERNFNSRPSARGDATTENSCIALYISIHAPPRGATAMRVGLAILCTIFQFTPLREGRLHRHLHLHRHQIFQFTPLREGRRLVDVEPRVGGVISIHAPPRGATIALRGVAHPDKFQFTPLREGRLEVVERRHIRRQFQFTPLREGRRVPIVYIMRVLISIHAPPRGATLLRNNDSQS